MSDPTSIPVGYDVDGDPVSLSGDEIRRLLERLRRLEQWAWRFRGKKASLRELKDVLDDQDTNVPRFWDEVIYY